MLNYFFPKLLGTILKLYLNFFGNIRKHMLYYTNSKT